MIANYLDFLRKLDDGEQYQSTLKTLVKAWQEQTPVSTNIAGLNSHQYALRVLEILRNDIKTYSASMLGASIGLYKLFFDKEIGIDYPEIEQIAKEYRGVRDLPTQNIEQQADDYRSMLLNVGGDLRSVLISLAENTLGLMYYHQITNPQYQQSTLSLCKHVYIPISHRLGFYKLKSRMEDLVLSYEKPSDYLSIKRKLKESESRRQRIIEEFIRPIKRDLKEQGLKFHIKGRTKSIHSIYTKMKKQDVPFEKVYDLWAIRIILDSIKKEEKASCWHAFSIVTNLYTPNISRLRDWISIPRDNGYESLHITVQTADKLWVEVQIRTERMDDEAENGMAAHWRYKGGKSQFGVDYWLSNVRKALEQNDHILATEELKSTNFSTELFAFTPQGDLKKLTIGATVLDFAFAIHSEIGMRCVGGIVNGKNVSMKHLLRNGDQVHILTSKNQRPSLDWLNLVVSTRARNRIKNAIDEQGQREAEQGKDILLRRLKNWKIDYQQEVLEKLASFFEYKNISDLYKAIYHEKIDLTTIKKVLTHQEEIINIDDKSRAEINDSYLSEEETDNLSESTDILIIDQLDNVNYSLAKCCHPIPGDKIFGFVTVSKGISIHRINCPNAKDMKKRYPYRIIPSRWKAKEEKTNFRAEIFVEGIDKTGIYSNLSSLISKQLGIHILNINLNGDGQNFQGKIVIKVYNLEQLETVLQHIRALDGVMEAYRHA